MKQFSNRATIIITIITLSIASCKKDTVDKGAADLSNGRAAISFKSSPDFMNSGSFNVKNTASTTATTQPLGSSSRTIKLMATDKVERTLSTEEREVVIDLLLSDTDNTSAGNIIIDLAKISGRPQAKINLNSFSTILGFTSGGPGGVLATGQLTITSLTANQIEGYFNGLVGIGLAPLTITNGSFAGKF